MIAYRLLVSGEPLDSDFLVKVSDEFFVATGRPAADRVSTKTPVAVG
jgi:hypothetical protein